MSVNIPRMLSDMRDCLGWPYASPGSTAKDASSGIDCSGMFVRAFRLQGAGIYHGSNTIYRSYCTRTGRMDKSKLAPGVAVFKNRADGKEPEKFRSDGLGNFYHIGCVVSVDPLRIIHSSTGGVKEVSSLAGWTHYGYLKNVDYEGSDNAMTDPVTQTAKAGAPDTAKATGSAAASVTASVSPLSGSAAASVGTAIVDVPNNGTVNIRARPSASATILSRLPEGTRVEVLETAGEWSRVSYPQTGYVKAEFLRKE